MRFFFINKVSEITADPVEIKCKLNKIDVVFEIDTGSGLSTINSDYLYKMKHDEITIEPTTRRATAYSTHNVNFVGEVLLQVNYCGKLFPHKFYVVENKVSLLGRDLCRKFGIHLCTCDDHSNINSNECSTCNNISRDKLDFKEVMNKHAHFLSNDFMSNVKEKVSLELDSDATPKFCKARSVPVRYRQLVKQEIDSLSKRGIIERVYKSDWACPTVNVLKSNGKIRICGDFSCTINNQMRCVKYPLPTVEEVIARVGNAKVFSKIDLENAYLQLPLDDQSKKYTTINTSEGLYQYNYLPFGISSSPGIFQSYLERILSGIEPIVIYQDDISIMTETEDEHAKVLDQVLCALHAAGVKLKHEKCQFHVDSVQYLGFIFSAKGVRPSQEKVRAILDAPTPQNIKEVQSFLGLATYYSRFIRNFSTVLAPMYSLCKKNARFHWGNEQQKCFDLLKSVFKSDKPLRFFDPNRDTALETDSSSYGLGAVLLQRYENAWYPVQFASRTLNSAQKNYSQIERECLSVVFGCERFRKFLLGSRFEVRNDHRPLKKLLGTSSSIPMQCSARLQRWALRLSQFDFEFKYIKGSENVTSDFLSRLPLKEIDETIEPYEIIYSINAIDEMPVTVNDVRKHTDADITLRTLKSYIIHGFPSDVDKKFRMYKKENLTIAKGCIMRQNRVLIPDMLRAKVLKQFHTGHPGICAMKSSVRSLIWYPNIDQDVENLVKKCNECQSIRAKPSQKLTTEWPKTNKKWSRIHIDHFFFENKIFLLAIDSLTKYIEVEIVKSVSTEETIDTLRMIFSRNGLPDTIVSDNATSFVSSEFRDFMTSNSIVHLTPPPYSPASNGQAERAVKIIKDLMKKNKIGSLRNRLTNVLLFYRNIPNSTTGMPPAVALNGRNYTTVKERINPYHVPSVKSKEIPLYKVGDSVLVLNLRPGPPKWYKSTITQIIGKNIYMVLVHALQTEWKRHIQQMLPIPNDYTENVNENSVINPRNENVIDVPPSSSVPVVPSNSNMAPSSIVVSSDAHANIDVSPESTTTPTESVAPRQSQSAVQAQPELRRSTRIKKPVERLTY